MGPGRNTYIGRSREPKNVYNDCKTKGTKWRSIGRDPSLKCFAFWMLLNSKMSH